MPCAPAASWAVRVRVAVAVAWTASRWMIRSTFSRLPRNAMASICVSVWRLRRGSAETLARKS
jgi:hypothetical protein